MENQTITLNVPSRKSNQVDFKGYKMYTEGDTANPNGLWLGNISFTPETEEAGLELLTQLKNFEEAYPEIVSEDYFKHRP